MVNLSGKLKVSRSREDHPAWCGEWSGGSKDFCHECESLYVQRFPQGWRGYPGDVCKHGVYTGGCGIDWMCGACEYGE